MTSTIKTKRLILQPISMSDKNAMVRLIMADKDVMQWLPDSEITSTLKGQTEVALDYLGAFTKSWKENSYGVWAICSNDVELCKPGSFIGYCGFIPGKIEGVGPEVAFALSKSMWGNGLIPEALAYCLDWIFKNNLAPSAHAVTDNENTASRKVLEKVGMKYRKNVDLYDSVANGYGLLPLYVISRERFIGDISVI